MTSVALAEQVRVIDFTDPRFIGAGSDFDRWAAHDEALQQRRAALKADFLREIRKPFDAQPSDFLRSGCKHITEVRHLFEQAADRDFRGEYGFEKLYATVLLLAERGVQPAVDCLHWLANSYADQFYLDGGDE